MKKPKFLYGFNEDLMSKMKLKDREILAFKLDNKVDNALCNRVYRRTRRVDNRIYFQVDRT